MLNLDWNIIFNIINILVLYIWFGCQKGEHIFCFCKITISDF